MGLNFSAKLHRLTFLFDAGTSRGVLKHKQTWLIKVHKAGNTGVEGWGEAGPLAGLSVDDVPDFEAKLQSELDRLSFCKAPETVEAVNDMVKSIPDELPSIKFGIETALLDFVHGGKRKYFENDFFEKGEPLKINGLIWMGTESQMIKRLNEKLRDGFSCIKFKIGALNIEEELRLLNRARDSKNGHLLELRVDANGAFLPDEAISILNKLRKLNIHSIEQPIKPGQVASMASLCANSPVPIALDEELVGVTGYDNRYELLCTIKPQYIILKPGLLGGFEATSKWISIANELGIGWWITSALESNIGLNAICQFASKWHVKMPQGLGTGNLYSNNIESPLQVKGEEIYYLRNNFWGEW